MKKILRIALGCMVFVLLSSFTDINAKTKLDPGTEKKIDLDGDGKKEKIAFYEGESNYELSWVSIYVNGKELYYYYVDKNQDRFFGAYAYVLDINSSDKYKEIIIDFEDEFEHVIRAFRYKNNKLNILFDTGYISYTKQLSSKQNKGNTVLFSKEVYCALGNNLEVYAKYKIKNKSLTEIVPKAQTLKLLKNPCYEKWFIAAKSIDVYSKYDGKVKKTTISSGTKFKATKLRLVNGEPVYALIDIKGGKKNAGWIKVDSWGYEEGQKLVKNASFAG